MTERIFFTDSVEFLRVETKGGEEYYVEGYISTSDKDLYNDVVTVKAMEDMVAQLKTKKVKLDVEHASWRGGSPNIVPVGLIEDARLEQKGIFVRAKLNKHVEGFKSLWGAIKDGFLDAFSIAYKATKAAEKVVNGSTIRVLDGLELLNVALTGNPVNPECKMTAVFTKSISDFSPEETTVQPVVEEPEKIEGESMAENEAVPPVVEEKSEPIPPALDVAAELKSRDDIIAELKSRIDAKEAEFAELKAMKEQFEALKVLVEAPQLKAKVEETPVAKTEERKVKALDMVR